MARGAGAQHARKTPLSVVAGSTSPSHVLAQHQPVRRRQKVRDDPDAADLALAVFNRWLFHCRTRSVGRRRARPVNLAVMPALVAGTHVFF
jgi:hypothetical protein